MKRFTVLVELPDGRLIKVDCAEFSGSGKNAPIGAVFANATGGHPLSTEAPAEKLAARGFRVITIEPDHTAKLSTDDRVAIMNHIGREHLGRFAAIGFSVGGDVASRCANRDYIASKNGAERHVLGLASAAGGYEASDRFITGIVARMTEEHFLDRGQSGGLQEFLGVLRGSSRKSVHAYANHIEKMSSAELTAFHFLCTDIWEEGQKGGSLHNLLDYRGGPTFYIHGDAEIEAYLPRIQASKHVSEVAIPNAGHFMDSDNPDAYADALARFMTEVNREQVAD